MMMLEDFATRLRQRASAIGLNVKEDAGLIASGFRGREPSDAKLPAQKMGAWYGSYPVILATLLPTDRADFSQQTKAFHAQVLIARSYVPVQNVVDMHLFLLFQANPIDDTQAAAIDKLERDETICRKLVFVPGDTPDAFDGFIERTFLARPWDAQKPQTKGFQLDQPAALVQEILEKQGLSSNAAEAWVVIAESYRNGEISSPQEFVDDLVVAMDGSDE